MKPNQTTQVSQPRVVAYARGMFMVESSTREGISHLVDLEGFDGEDIYCSCESFTLSKIRPCKHITYLLS